jgi:hypothetical protein
VGCTIPTPTPQVVSMISGINAASFIGFGYGANGQCMELWVTNDSGYLVH